MMRAKNLQKLMLLCFALSLSWLAGCSGGISGTGAGSGGSGTGNNSNGLAGTEAGDSNVADGLPVFSFVPDEGIRLACASVPRIGKAKDVYYLYHAAASAGADGGANSARVATSVDAFSFGSPEPLQTRLRETKSGKPIIETNRVGFPEVVTLKSDGLMAETPSTDIDTTSETACTPLAYRIFKHNGALGGFGNAVVSECSQDGQWFMAESGERLISEDGGKLGVSTAFTLGNQIQLFTMDGQSPNAQGEFQHRVWHYQAEDAVGDRFSLVSADPLQSGPSLEAKDRQNDPAAYTLADGNAVIMTMRQHNGPINPPNVITGEIYGWSVAASNPSKVNALLPGQALDTSEHTDHSALPLIRAEDFSQAGHAVYSINDPSLMQLADGAYRLFVGALVNIDMLPENKALLECAEDIAGGKYSWVILSATSR